MHPRVTAESGQLAAFQWLNMHFAESRHNWSGASMSASTNGHLHVVQWLLENALRGTWTEGEQRCAQESSNLAEEDLVRVKLLFEKDYEHIGLSGPIDGADESEGIARVFDNPLRS